MTAHARPRVLVVDDEPESGLLVRAILTEARVKVIGVADGGRRALEMVASLHPDVVLLDVRMPDMDGFETARQIKLADPSTAVILLTAYEDSNLARGAEEVGAYCYLLKDGPPSMIVEMIERAWHFGQLAEERPA